jgi:N-acetylneuraminic acid mutarotase
MGAEYKPLKSMDVYDFSTETWETHPAEMAEGRSRHASAVDNGKLYVVGGMDANDAPIRTVEVFDFQTATWSVSAPTVLARHSLVVAVHNHTLYVATCSLLCQQCTIDADGGIHGGAIQLSPRGSHGAHG